jgi:hypothetical protein
MRGAAQIYAGSRATVVSSIHRPNTRSLFDTDQGLVRDDDANASFTAAEIFDQPQASGRSSQRFDFARSEAPFATWEGGLLGVKINGLPTG